MEVGGKTGMLFASLLELGHNIALTVLLVYTYTFNYYRFWSWNVKREPGFVIIYGLCVTFVFLSFISTIFLFYAAVSSGNLKTRRRICVRWLIFRMLSFLIPIIFLFASGDQTVALICAAVVILWITSIGFVSNFLSNASEVLERQANKAASSKRHYRRSIPRNLIVPTHAPLRPLQPLHPPPKNMSSSSGVVELSEEHLKQLEQFQDYVRRTSWCSWSDDGSRSSRTSSAVQGRF